MKNTVIPEAPNHTLKKMMIPREIFLKIGIAKIRR